MTKSLLPPNASSWELGMEQAVLEPSMDLSLRALWSPTDCPVFLLPWLAWSLGIEDWSSDWTEAIKRERIRKAIQIHRTKGTKSSVQALISTLGGNVTIREWWQTTPPGTPHTFEIILTASSQDGTPASSDYIDELIDEITQVKPLRSHFTFTEGLTSEGTIGVLGRARVANFVRLDFVSAG